jgi:hypothetical protein
MGGFGADCLILNSFTVLSLLLAKGVIKALKGFQQLEGYFTLVFLPKADHDDFVMSGLVMGINQRLIQTSLLVEDYYCLR